MDSGCGSIGRVVASDTRGPRFKSSHLANFYKEIYLSIVNCVEETKMKKKRPGMAHLKKDIVTFFSARPAVEMHI